MTVGSTLWDHVVVGATMTITTPLFALGLIYCWLGALALQRAIAVGTLESWLAGILVMGLALGVTAIPVHIQRDVVGGLDG